MASRVKLNHAGIAAALKSGEMHAAVQAEAEKVKANVEAQGITVGGFAGDRGEIPLPVEVSMSTTDRAHANVSLAHPAGASVQAKHGALTKAAGQAGLKVTEVLYYTTKSGKTRRATQAQIDNWTRGSR